MPDKFSFCPSCGSMQNPPRSCFPFSCKVCHYVFFRNVASAGAALLTYKSNILLTLRKNSPKKACFDLPGGFVDTSGSSLEAALSREIMEELNIHIPSDQWHYLCSFPNTYPYKKVTYATLDSFFIYNFKEKPMLKAQDDIAAAQWISLDTIPSLMQDIAFNSVQRALHTFLLFIHQNT